MAAATRLTGLSPELLRAWEKRYRVVEPLRSPGGTRRYRGSDIERLRRVKAAVDAGQRISVVSQLDLDALERGAGAPAPAARSLDEIFGALDRLDAVEVQRTLSLQLAALGPARFASECVAPLLREIGERWADDRLRIASEHLATAVIRALLGAALQPNAASLFGPRVVFATPGGERHELGLQMAAVVALGAGANPLYLGAELPVEEILAAAQRTDAAAVAIGLVTLPLDAAERAVAALRGGLPLRVHLWLGGARARELPQREGVEALEGFEALERRVARLGFERTRKA
jgi:DNA-binding transcriptional MerR regulator/methylmalonyl-CoA mutase cobalamin-binding subunit